MATHAITIANEEFSTSDEFEAADPEKARKQAIGSALAIGSDQVAGGKPYFRALVTLREGNKELIQFVVSLGASPLKESG
jgi:hypothetical protein